MDNMSFNDYKKKGPAMAKEMNAEFEKAKVYFEKAYALKKDDMKEESISRVMKGLRTIYSKLKMTDKALEMDKKIQNGTR